MLLQTLYDVCRIIHSSIIVRFLQLSSDLVAWMCLGPELVPHMISKSVGQCLNKRSDSRDTSDR